MSRNNDPNVDQRIVSMEFDNARFEKNCKQTMSTLDKLKAKLNFGDKATKSFEDIDKASSKVDISNLERSVDALTQRFSTMGIIGISALDNLTKKAIYTGEKLVKSLSVDQLTAGWAKYGEKTASVQTIMNSTGKSIDEVNGYLNKLMWFSDETSYSFNAMTQSIAQLTSSGGDIEKLIPMVMGIANATAFAGKGQAEFSRSIYNLNQSYSSGALKYMDWRSLEMAGTGSKELKQAMIDAGIALGTIKEGQVTISNFGTTLQKNWATTAVMEKAFGKFAEMSLKAKEMVDAGEVETASEAYEILSKQYDDISITAAKAAQEAKTFTEAIDATKDAVSSGWMKTFELIFGNYDEAKRLWTDVANGLWDIFASGAEDRNHNIAVAMGDGYDQALKTIEDAGIGIYTFMTAIDEAAKESGEFTTALTNGSLSYKEAFADGTLSANTLRKALGKLNGVVTIQNGYTEDAVDLAKKLADGTSDVTDKFMDFAEVANRKSGRTLLLESINNLLSGTTSLLTSVKTAWNDAIDTNSGSILYSAVSGFSNLTERFKDFADSDSGKRVGKILTSVFSILDSIYTLGKKITGGAKKILGSILSKFNIDILKIIEQVTDLLLKFNEWTHNTTAIDEVTDFLTDGIDNLSGAMSRLFGWFDKLPGVSKVFENIGNFFSQMQNNGLNIIAGLSEGIKEDDSLLTRIGTICLNVINKVKDIFGIHSPSKVMTELGQYVVQGFSNGIVNEGKSAKESVSNVFNGVLDSITKFFSNIDFKGFFSGLGEKFKDIDLDTVLSNGMVAALAYMAYKLYKGLQKPLTSINTLLVGVCDGLGRAATNLGNVFGSVNNLVKQLRDSIRSYTKSLNFENYATGILKLAGAIAILAAACIAISYCDVGKVAQAAGIIVGLAVAIGIFAYAIGKISSSGLDIDLKNKGIKFQSTMSGIIAIGMGLMMAAGSLAIIASIDSTKFVQALVGMAVILTAFIILMNVYSKIPITSQDSLKKTSKMVRSVAGSIMILSLSMKILGKVNLGDIKAGLLVLAAYSGIVAILSYVSAKPLDTNNLWKTILSTSAGMILLSTAFRSFDKLSNDSVERSIGVTAAMLALVTVFSRFNKYKSGDWLNTITLFSSISAMLFSMSISVRILGGMNIANLAKGVVAVTLFAAVVTGMLYVLSHTEPVTLKKTATALLMVSVLLGTMAVCAVILGILPVKWLAKGITAAALLGATITLILQGCKNASGAILAIADISTMVVALSACALLLGLLPTDQLFKGVSAIAILGITISMMLSSIKHIENSVGSIIATTVMVLAMAALVGVLVSISKDSDSAINAIYAVSMLVGSLALLMKSVSSSVKMGKGSLINIALSLGVMIGIVGIVAGLVYVLKKYAPDISIANDTAISLGILLASVSAGIVILSKMSNTGGENIMNAGVGVLAMSGALIAIAEALVVLKDVDVPVDKAAALAILMMGLVAAIDILVLSTKIFKVGGDELKNVFGLMLAILIGVGAVMIFINDMPDIKLTAEKAASIVILMLGISAAIDSMIPIALAGKKLENVSFLGMLKMLGIILLGIVGLALVLAGLGAIDKYTGMMSTIATMFSNFVKGLIPGIDSLKGISEEAVSGAGRMTALLAIFVGDQLIGIIAILADLLGGTTGMISVARGMSNFMKESRPFFDAVAKVKPSVATGALKISEAYSNFVNGLNVTSSSTISKASGMSEQMVKFAEAVVTFSETVQFMPDNAIEKTEVACDVLNAVSNAARNIPNSGGFAGLMAGNNDLGPFAAMMRSFGINSRIMVTALPDFTESEKDKIEKSIEVLGKIIETAKTIPNTGGLAGLIVGNNDLDDFANMMPSLGTGITGLLQNLPTFSFQQMTTVQNAAYALADIARAADLIPNYGSLMNLCGTVNSINQFVSTFGVLGAGMSKFAENLNGMTPADSLTVLNGANALSNLLTGLSDISRVPTDMDSIIGKLELDADNQNSFVYKMGALGESVSSFAENVPDESSAVKMDSAVKTLTHIFAALGQLDSSYYFNGDVEAGVHSVLDMAGQGLATLGKNVAEFTKDSATVSGVERYLNSLSSIFNFMSSIGSGDNVNSFNNLITTFSDPAFIESFKADNYYSFFVELESFMSKIENVMGFDKNTSLHYANCVTAGKNLLEGLLNGLNDRTLRQAVERDSFNIGDTVVRNLNRGAGNHSPSHKTFQSGKYIDMGLINGLNSLKSRVRTTSMDVGSTAANTVARAIQTVSEAVNADVDTQPTIRPVMDLSDIDSGMNRLRSMTNLRRSMTVSGAVIGAARSMSEGQNGSNRDVVNAINDLGKSMNRRTGDTYIIDGVNYNEGSDTSDAIRTLVHAVKVERRK